MASTEAYNIDSLYNGVRYKYTLDGYNIMANNQNLYAEYEGDFHFQNVTIALYSGDAGPDPTTPSWAVTCVV